MCAMLDLRHKQVTLEPQLKWQGLQCQSFQASLLWWQKRRKNTYREGVQNIFLLWACFGSSHQCLDYGDGWDSTQEFWCLLTSIKGHIKEQKTASVTMVRPLQLGMPYTDVKVTLCAKVSGERCEQGWNLVCTITELCASLQAQQPGGRSDFLISCSLRGGHFLTFHKPEQVF